MHTIFVFLAHSLIFLFLTQIKAQLKVNGSIINLCLKAGNLRNKYY